VTAPARKDIHHIHHIHHPSLKPFYLSLSFAIRNTHFLRIKPTIIARIRLHIYRKWQQQWQPPATLDS
jgi:hypothetical protein